MLKFDRRSILVLVIHRLWIVPTLLLIFSCTASPERHREISDLTGSWEVYPGAIYTPENGDAPEITQYQEVPPVGGRYRTNEGERFVVGPITYRLTVRSVPRAPLMGVYIPPFSGDTTAWVNGERSGPLPRHGVVPLVPDSSGTADLTLVINGHHYPREGLALLPPRLGPLSELLSKTSRRLFWDGLLVGGLLILAAYHLLLRLGQSLGFARNVPTITMAVFLLILALRILLVEGAMVLSSMPWIGPGVSLRLRGFVVYPLVALYLRYLNHMFPGDSRRKVLRVLQGASWIWMVLSLIIPARWWMDLLFTWMPLLVAALVTSAMTLLRAYRARQNSALLLVVAMLILAAGTGVEVARYLGVVSTFFSPIPLTAALFGGLSSLALSRRVFDARISLANLREQAQRDGLTGLNNRRTLDARLDEEWARHMRSGNSLAAIMVDIDHFKPYNDTLGHQAGDTVIQAVAQTLTEHAQRASDVAARYGGEEFFLLLPSTTAADAYLVADRIRRAMHSQAIHHPTTKDGIVTLSIGVAAVIPEHDEHGPRGTQSLVEAADRALYDAKRGGRDAVRTTSVEGHTSRDPSDSDESTTTSDQSPAQYS